MEKIKKLFAHKVFRIIKWVFLILIGLYLLLVFYRVYDLFDQDKTNAQIKKVHDLKITLDDVMGKNLPPMPGEEEGKKTIKGIDVNNNNIRDDVEVAIFNKYPNSPKIRGPLLQYAQASQMQITQPFLNTELATEVSREHSRGFQCVSSLVPRKADQETFDKLDSYLKFVDDLQFNTKERKNMENRFYENVRSYSELEKAICDIDYLKL